MYLASILGAFFTIHKVFGFNRCVFVHVDLRTSTHMVANNLPSLVKFDLSWDMMVANRGCIELTHTDHRVVVYQGWPDCTVSLCLRDDM